MKLSIASTIVCSLFLLPSLLLAGNTDDITTRLIGAPNTLDFTLYYGKFQERDTRLKDTFVHS